MKLKLILATATVGVVLALPGVSSAWAQAPPLQDSVSLTEDARHIDLRQHY